MSRLIITLEGLRESRKRGIEGKILERRKRKRNENADEKV
jgi:hypothetical protein